jgi:hypothetical protein
MFGSYQDIKKKGLDIEAILKNYSKQNNGSKKKSFVVEKDKEEIDTVADEKISPEMDTDIIEVEKPGRMTREKTVAK